jgi:hypothetical protein
LSATARSFAGPEATPARGVATRAAALIAGALALAALSLLRPWSMAFDPWAWLSWGRQTWHLALDTTTGPSWKPFPVLFTIPISLTGGTLAPILWSTVARAGGLLAIAGGYALGTRLAGRWAGVGAAAAILLSTWWTFNTLLAQSEGLLAAAVLWGVVAHLSGRPRAALWLLVAAALMRPEAWPFLGAYGVWLWRARPETRRSVVAAALVVPLLWFGPDAIGAGGALGASKAAKGTPSPGSAGLTAHPALTLLGDTVTVVSLPALVAALLAVVLGDRTIRVLAGGAVVWIAIVAAMTAMGYAGNPRYLVAAAAILAALAGVGAVRVAAARGAPLGAALLAAAVLAATAGHLRTDLHSLSQRGTSRATLAGVIDRAGGRDALLRCGPLRTSTTARSIVAWYLDLPIRAINLRPQPPVTVVQARWFFGAGLEPVVDPRGYDVKAASRYWRVLEQC